jgi:hypothetical protein
MTHKSRFFNVWRTGALVAIAGLIGGVSLDTAAYAQEFGGRRAAPPSRT